MPSHLPSDQAQGLRRLFAHARVRFIPVVSNPHLAFGGLMLERVCSGFAERGVHTLVVDASERAPAADEMALVDLAACVEPLSERVAYLAARGLPLRFVDSAGSTQAFLQAAAEASPASQVILVHADAADLCRLFAQRARDIQAEPVCPLLLADDRPASVTHAYAAMKLLALRAGLKVHDLLLGAAARSPRAERIAVQLAMCADDFLGAVLRGWVHVDPASHATEAPPASLRRWVGERLGAREGVAGAPSGAADSRLLPPPGSRFAAANWAFN
jgi:flagellar biosynthesis protein FlhG